MCLVGVSGFMVVVWSLVVLLACLFGWFALGLVVGFVDLLWVVAVVLLLLLVVISVLVVFYCIKLVYVAVWLLVGLFVVCAFGNVPVIFVNSVGYCNFFLFCGGLLC